MSNNKDLTVIVIALLGGKGLAACLRRLETVLEEDGVPVIVVHAFGAAGECIEDWRRDFPRIGFLDTDQEPVPLRRQRGAEACESTFVAFIEDTTWPVSGWQRAILAGFDDLEVGAVGGPIGISGALSARASALGVSDYGRFHPAVLGLDSNVIRPTSHLPGNNLAYRRDLLLAALRQSTHGLIEAEVNDRLRRQGIRLVLHSGMAATYAGEDSYHCRLSARLQHGRLYGSGQSAGQPLAKRLEFCAAACALPIVLTGRALSVAVRALPLAKVPAVAIWIYLMATAWAIGEALGALDGEGQSLQSWR